MLQILISGITTVGQGGQLPPPPPPAFEEPETVTAALSL